MIAYHPAIWIAVEKYKDYPPAFSLIYHLLCKIINSEKWGVSLSFQLFYGYLFMGSPAVVKKTPPERIRMHPNRPSPFRESY
jgi:hypothetical protein